VKRFSALLPIVALLLGGCQKADTVKKPVAADLPALTGRVVDRANILSAPLEQLLAAKHETLERRTSDQFVVVTLASLKGKPIEDWGLRLGNGWGLGQKNKNNGVLLIVAPNERKVRIQVGFGLESTLTNQRCAEIIDRSILPQFQQGRLEAGITSGVDAVIDRLERPSSLEPARKAA
jgi:uncharacterized protein